PSPIGGTAWTGYDCFVGFSGASNDDSVVGSEFDIIYPNKTTADYNYDRLFKKHVTVSGGTVTTTSPSPAPAPAPAPAPPPAPVPAPAPAPAPIPSSAQVPSAPTNLSATAVSSTQINVTWMDNSSNEAGFRLYRCQTMQTWTLIATLGANQTSYSDS